MSVAIVDGLLGKDISPSNVKGSCVTGNCTWQDYQSLGVCSTVTDVSSTITSTCRKQGCNYSVPAIDENPTASGTVFETSRLRHTTLWVGASSPPPPPGIGSEPYMPPGLATLEQFYVIYVPDLTRWDELDVAEDHKDELVALQATLSLCVNTYHTSMTIGVMNTTLLSQEKIPDWQTGTESLEGTSFSTLTVTHGGERFWMIELNRNALHNYLSVQTFTGSVDSVAGSENDVVTRIAASLYDDRAGIRGLSDLLDNLTMSMSNAYVSTWLYTDRTNAKARLRTSTDIPDNFRGTSTSSEFYIHIVWAWMSVPIATVILSLIFLLITIHQSWQRRIPAWKSSLLAVLLGLSSETRSELGGIIRPKEMEEMAKKRNVRLESNGGQWQIVKAD